jgi:hypothetical protein
MAYAGPSGAKAHRLNLSRGAPEGAPFQSGTYVANLRDSTLARIQREPATGKARQAVNRVRSLPSLLNREGHRCRMY